MFSTKLRQIRNTDLLQTLKIENNNLSLIKQSQKLIRKFSDIFSKSDTDIGHTSLVKHKIELLDPELFKQKNRRILPSMSFDCRNYPKIKIPMVEQRCPV